MSQYQGYNFCPNCGAVTKDGVCTACGHKSKGAVLNKPTEPAYKSDTTVFDYTQTGVKTSFAGSKGTVGGSGKKGANVLLLAIISFVLITFFASVIYAYFHFRFVEGSSSVSISTDAKPEASVSVSKPEPTKLDVKTETDNTDEKAPGYFRALVLDKFEDFYLPEDEEVAEEDEYDYADETGYYVYDDYIRTDLDYKIINCAWGYGGSGAYMYGDNAPEDVYIYCSHPRLTDAPEIQDKINATIVEKSLLVCDMYEADCEYLAQDQVYYGDEHVYITYMDENVLSLLFFCDGYFADDSDEEPKLVSSTADTVNYDMKTGEEIAMPKIALSDEAFIDKLVKEIDEQNNSDILNDVDKFDILTAYKNGELKWFYNPFGVEIVFNVPYNYGFYSCTMDPNEIFKK